MSGKRQSGDRVAAGGRIGPCERCYRPGAEYLTANFQLCSHCDKAKAPAPVKDGGLAVYVCAGCMKLGVYLVDDVAGGQLCRARHPYFYGATCQGTLIKQN